MITAKAVLVNRTSPLGDVKDGVPDGKIYNVFPSTIETVKWLNPETGETGKSDRIRALNDDGISSGWIPLDCLKLEDS